MISNASPRIVGGAGATVAARTVVDAKARRQAARAMRFICVSGKN